MLIWIMLGVVCAAGAIGGAVNALLSDNGFLKPCTQSMDDQRSIIRPGALGNVMLGAVAAGASWGLYGPFTDYPMLGTHLPATPSLTVATLLGAVLVGMGGARVLTSEVDKRILHAAVGHAATAIADPTAAHRIKHARPAEVLKIAAAIPASPQKRRRTRDHTPETPSQGGEE